MRYFLDVEFNGFGGELISAAAISEDDERVFFYEAVLCENPTDWVSEHVLPVLETKPIRIEEVSQRFIELISSDPEPRIVADWPEDIAHAATLLTNGAGRRHLDNSVSFQLLGHSDFDTEKHSALPHNAYYDALALRNWILESENASMI